MPQSALSELLEALCAGDGVDLIRGSVFSGPGGFPKFESTWEGDRRWTSALDSDPEGRCVMPDQVEVPQLDDLSELGVVVEVSEEPGVASVTAWAKDGSSVTCTWNEIAGSATIRCIDGDEEWLDLYREAVSKVSVRSHRGGVQFLVWSRSEGVGGELLVQVGERVMMRDVVLRM
ncbi:hypothetical protein [Austwickia sp. TVS 96-490-7B]|uniref:hypothetical protein n=1 Tax=Austwickia sp. TVS 96-490-7B TaxID=2830843 RepID=UPI001C589CB4|nr:hypothetical protein [Austwickia sp. TVS 96-490-7B]